jgi:hypothetical protein
MSHPVRPVQATRQLWPKLHPLPSERAPLVVEREFTLDEHARLAYGVVPEQMEDRWFIFLEDATLFFHRSWTGHCIYQVTLARHGTTYVIAEALVNRDSTQYQGGGDDFDQRLLLFLINHLLLGEPYPLPMPSNVPAGITTNLYSHHVAGAGHKAPRELDLKDLLRWLWSWLWSLIK